MKRHYYIAEDLEELEKIGAELENDGINAAHIHVLSEDAAGASMHHLHPVNDFNARDVLHSAVIGASFGLLLSLSILILASVSGLVAQVGWAPFILLSIAMLGFSTWEGGLLGIHRPNHELRRFMSSIKKGRHVLLVDVNEQQENALARVAAAHTSLRKAHDGVPADTHWAKDMLGI